MESFLLFLQIEDIQIPISCSKRAIVKGLTEHIIFPFLYKIQDLLLDYIDINKDNMRMLLELTNKYTQHYMIAFNDRIKIQIKNEQEQLSKALLEKNIKQQKEIAEKEKQLQESKLNLLKKQNEHMTTFLTNFAHETKTPLIFILNKIDEVKEEAQRGKITSIPALEYEIRKLKDMVINILDVEKIFLDKPLYDHDTIINISSIVTSKLALYKSITNKKGIKIITEIRQDLYTLIDLKACDSILNNIIDNAIKYNAPVNGSIHVSLFEENQFVVLKIKDTGIGIPRKQLDYIFKPYYQSTLKKRTTQGIGAGLFIVKSILKEVDAEISIESKQGIGTTVTILFHKIEVTGYNKNKINKKEKLSHPTYKDEVVLKKEIFDENKKTIFFVDDNVESPYHRQSW